MRVTSIHHMYPGTYMHVFCPAQTGETFIFRPFQVVSWPYEKLICDDMIGLAVDVKRENGEFGYEYLADNGMGNKTYGNLAFSTREEAKAYRREYLRIIEELMS